MLERAVVLNNPRGLRLSAVLLQPEPAGPRPVVVFSHGWGSSKASARNRAIAEALVAAGMAALLFDYSGHGQSEGETGQQTLEDQQGDLRAALDWLQGEQPQLEPIGVAGSSSGGAVAVEVAVADPRVSALVLRAPSAATRPASIRRLQAPTLIVQGEGDPLMERNAQLAQALRCEHRLCTVAGATHLFDEPGTFRTAERETVRWFGRWLAGDKLSAGGEALRDPPPARQPASPTHFCDRVHAGRELARRLAPQRARRPVVLGLPRGGVAVAAVIARELDAELDVLVSRKVRAPSQPELAIGAIAEGEAIVWNEDVVRLLGLSKEVRERQLAQARRELDERRVEYRTVAPRIELRGRAVIVTDDGVATGATLKAALQALSRAGTERLIVALPGGASDTLAEIAALPGVDEMVALATPEPFWAVGQLYDEFAPVSSDEVCRLLREARARPRAA
jgi:predicted phosphoribosyltransferase/alpha/beta superfamily hydrolase